MEYTVHPLKCFSLVKKLHLMDSWNKGINSLLCSTCPQLSKCFGTHTPSPRFLSCVFLGLCYRFSRLFVFFFLLFFRQDSVAALNQHKTRKMKPVLPSQTVHRTGGSNQQLSDRTVSLTITRSNSHQKVTRATSKPSCFGQECGMTATRECVPA